MNDTTKRYPRSTAEAFADERYHSGTHMTTKEYLFLKQPSHNWPFAIVLAIILCVFGYHFYTIGTTSLDEAMAVEAARAEAIEQAQAEKRKQDALKDMLGGPESTCVEVEKNMYSCVNKRGFKQVAK